MQRRQARRDHLLRTRGKLPSRTQGAQLGQDVYPGKPCRVTGAPTACSRTPNTVSRAGVGAVMETAQVGGYRSTQPAEAIVAAVLMAWHCMGRMLEAGLRRRDDGQMMFALKRHAPAPPVRKNSFKFSTIEPLPLPFPTNLAGEEMPSQPSTRDDLAQLIDDGRLYPVFQPLVSMETGQVYAYEALIRGPDGSEFHRPDRLFGAARA
ncbi:MAG: hypothetical protein ACOZB1_02185, partial [Pseudomonadota bacterium]